MSLACTLSVCEKISWKINFYDPNLVKAMVPCIVYGLLQQCYASGRGQGHGHQRQLTLYLEAFNFAVVR